MATASGFAGEEFDGGSLVEGIGGVVDAYFELCTRYHVKPVPAVTIALRFEGVTYLQLEPEFGAADLLPLAELLQVSPHDGMLNLSSWLLQMPAMPLS
jgi:hypothetical protein